MIDRLGLHRFGAYESYEDAKKLLSKGHRPFYRMMQRDGYWLVDDMTEQDTPKPEFRKLKRHSLLVQSLPVWVGTHIKSALFFQALYSWDELWGTVAAAWTIFGDPRSLSDDRWNEWLGEKIPLLHGGYFAGRGRSIFLVRLEDLGDTTERWVALYDHAYRVMDWLGFVESTMPMWWLLAFMGGQWESIEVWLPWFKTYIAYSLTGGLRPFQDMVKAMAKDKPPKQSNAVALFCPPPSYDIKDRNRDGRYPQFDPRLLFPSYRRWIVSASTYMPDPLTKQKLEAIQGLWRSTDPTVKVKGLDAEEQAKEARQVMEQLLKHPMYRQIQAAKFQMSKESRQRLDKISALVNECNQGKRPIADLLEWALRSNSSLMAELAEEKRVIGEVSVYKQKQIGDKVYRQVDGWFRRRKSPMPKPNRDWREKIIG